MAFLPVSLIMSFTFFVSCSCVTLLLGHHLLFLLLLGMETKILPGANAVRLRKAIGTGGIHQDEVGGSRASKRLCAFAADHEYDEDGDTVMISPPEDKALEPTSSSVPTFFGQTTVAAPSRVQAEARPTEIETESSSSRIAVRTGIAIGSSSTTTTAHEGRGGDGPDLDAPSGERLKISSRGTPSSIASCCTVSASNQEDRDATMTTFSSSCKNNVGEKTPTHFHQLGDEHKNKEDGDKTSSTFSDESTSSSCINHTQPPPPPPFYSVSRSMPGRRLARERPINHVARLNTAQKYWQSEVHAKGKSAARLAEQQMGMNQPTHPFSTTRASCMLGSIAEGETTSKRSCGAVVVDAVTTPPGEDLRMSNYFTELATFLNARDSVAQK
ncbi:unnamed protein product [Amoebophrya sp. A25]|nr:unnamed protein product [Amoebophrya sp. A25]|eukprot:GSA25T00009188001.1